MARQGWLADNAGRAYPFVQDAALTMTRSDSVAVLLPAATIVDFSCMIGLGLGFAVPYLHQISRTAGTLTFDFRAGGLLGSFSLQFTRPVTAPDFATDYSDAVEIDTGLPPLPVCGDTLYWEGTLTTGYLSDLASHIADGQTLTAADDLLAIESCQVQELDQSYVRAVNLANAVRTHVTAAVGCTALPVGPYADGTPVQVLTCLEGPLTFIEGYNCSILQNGRDNSLTISGAVGGGAGSPCTEVVAYPDEVPPGDSSLLSGGPTCNEVINSINGLSSAMLRLVPGSGLKIVPDPDHVNGLIVDADLHDLTACPGS